MAASAAPLKSVLAPPRHEPVLTKSKQGHEPVALSAVSRPDSGLDGSCICGSFELPLTSEPPLIDVAPLTSEPPLTEAPLTSEPTAAGLGTEQPDI